MPNQIEIVPGVTLRDLKSGLRRAFRDDRIIVLEHQLLEAICIEPLLSLARTEDAIASETVHASVRLVWKHDRYFSGKPELQKVVLLADKLRESQDELIAQLVKQELIIMMRRGTYALTEIGETFVAKRAKARGEGDAGQPIEG